MALNARFPTRTRNAPQRPKINGDENAISKTLRQPSAAGTIRNNIKIGLQRPALSEVTTTAVNRRETKLPAKEKDDIALKRPTVIQRAPPVLMKPSVVSTTSTNTLTVRAQLQRPQRPLSLPVRQSEPPVVAPTLPGHVAIHEPIDDSMDVEETGQQEVETMVEVADESEIEEVVVMAEERAATQWPDVGHESAKKIQQEIDRVRENFVDEVDMMDMSMVSEYSNEIFEYMSKLEGETMPNPDYITAQTEITWDMRQTLVDWLLQVHLRYRMLPETLWIAVNIVDRFLTKRVVSLVKLQLVGVTAMFIASKYEEILAPSVDEFVELTERGYTREEILKGERIVLQTIDFRISSYCSPYSWVRKISKADDYDIQTRTLSKFLMEVTLLDHRFLGVKPSHIAAIGMYTARKMLGGTWDDSFVFYSNFTEKQLMPGHRFIVEKLSEDGFEKQYVSKKYANKKFLKASVFAMDWARSNLHSPALDLMD